MMTTPRKSFWAFVMMMASVFMSLCLPTQGFVIPLQPSASSTGVVLETSMVGSSRRSHQGRGGYNLLREKSGSDNSSSNDGSASVRFSGAEGLTSTTTNPLDAFLTVLASDIASIALGLIGLVVVVAHRVSLLDDSSAESLTLQTRTDLLAVFACGSVLLNGITKLDVTAAMADSVVLEGNVLSEPELCMESTEEDAATLVWALESLLAATPATTAVVLERDSGVSSAWRVLARGGTVPMDTQVPDSTPILDRVSSMGNTKETYLPTLQALPGKRELPYLPSNAQLALLVPILASEDSSTTRRVLVLGSNRAKSFSPRDVAWSRIVAERMATTQ